MKKHQVLSSILLLTAAIIWGFAFVAQEKLSDSVPPFTVNAIRSLIASAVLIPVAAVTRHIKGKKLLENNKMVCYTKFSEEIMLGKNDKNISTKSKNAKKKEEFVPKRA